MSVDKPGPLPPLRPTRATTRHNELLAQHPQVPNFDITTFTIYNYNRESIKQFASDRRHSRTTMHEPTDTKNHEPTSKSKQSELSKSATNNTNGKSNNHDYSTRYGVAVLLFLYLLLLPGLLILIIRWQKEIEDLKKLVADVQDEVRQLTLRERNDADLKLIQQQVMQISPLFML